MTIVTYAHRPKRRPRKKAAAATITGPAIVTAKNPRRRTVIDVPDMTPEEHQRRGAAATALFQELVRRVQEE